MQTRVVLDNARELLAAAGFECADVVSSRVYITSAGAFRPMNDAYRDGVRRRSRRRARHRLSPSS